MSETQVAEQIYVTTTITEVEENPTEEEKMVEIKATSAHADTAELSGTTSRSTGDEETEHRYDDHLVDGNSEAVSITSSKLLEEYPSPYHLKEKSSTAQMSTRSYNMNSTSEKDLLENFGQCTECNRPNTGEDNWCRSCNSKHFRSQFDKWTSENSDVDKIIQDSQLSAKHSNYVLEWIPFDKFKDVKYVSKGGYGTVYSAYWLDGQILGWDKELEQWKRHGADMVALKRLHNSQFINSNFLNQVCHF